MLLTDSCEPFAAPSQNLVGVALMPHIPDQSVVRCVVQVVQRDSQFNHPKAGAEVPT